MCFQKCHFSIRLHRVTTRVQNKWSCFKDVVL